MQLAREVLDIAAVMVKPGATTEEIDHAVHLVGTHRHMCKKKKEKKGRQAGSDAASRGCNVPAMCSLSPGLHGEELLPVAAQLLQLPQVLLHVRQRGHLPRHPGQTAAAGRRHPQR